jgi:hypothetical protein
MQVAGVADIENMKKELITKMVLDTIFLNLRAKLIGVPIFELLRIINSRIRSSGYSLKSNPSIINGKKVEMHKGDFERIFLLLHMLKLVLNLTYLTWLHSSK